MIQSFHQTSYRTNTTLDIKLTPKDGHVGFGRLHSHSTFICISNIAHNQCFVKMIN